MKLKTRNKKARNKWRKTIEKEKRQARERSRGREKMKIERGKREDEEEENKSKKKKEKEEEAKERVIWRKGLGTNKNPVKLQETSFLVSLQQRTPPKKNKKG